MSFEFAQWFGQGITASAPDFDAESPTRCRSRCWTRLLGIVTVLVPLIGQAANPTPEEVIRTSVEGLRHAIQRDAAMINQDPERVIPLIKQHIIPNVNLSIFARLILGPHWQRASAAQRAAFTATFAEALLHIYGIHATSYTDAQIEYLGAFPIPTKATVVQVRTEVRTANGQSARVDYRMALNNGDWKAIDASVDGISIVRTYRAALNEEIQQIGLDGVIERMNNRRDTARVQPVD